MPIWLVRFTCWIINLFSGNKFSKNTQNDVDIIEIGLAYHFNRTFAVGVQCICWTNNSIIHTHIRIVVHIQTNSTVQKVNKSFLIAFSEKIWQSWHYIIWGRFYYYYYYYYTRIPLESLTRQIERVFQVALAL